MSLIFIVWHHLVVSILDLMKYPSFIVLDVYVLDVYTGASG